jgi:hypothetical protein
MTLLISVISNTMAVQVADCRITLHGKEHDANAIKVFGVGCADARFSLGYAGVGEIEGKRTDRWLVDEIRALFDSGHYGVRSLTWKLAERVEEAIAHLRYKGVLVHPQGRGFWLTMAGFHDTDDEGPFSRPFITSVSNAENRGPDVPLLIKPVFTVDPGMLRPGLPNSGFTGKISGAVKALMDENDHARETHKLLNQAMRHIKRVDLGEIPSGKHTADLLVAVARRASRHPKHGRLIGREFISVVTRRHDSFGNVYFHYKDDSTRGLIPHLISPWGEIAGGEWPLDSYGVTIVPELPKGG